MLLHFFFGLSSTTLTPESFTYIFLCLINGLLCTWSAIHTQRTFFRIYLILCAINALIQNSPVVWGLSMEAITSVFTCLFVFETTLITLQEVSSHRFQKGLITIISVSAIAAFLTTIVSPGPWPGYPASWYYTRLLTVIFAGSLSLGCATWLWIHKPPAPLGSTRHAWLSVVWFASVVVVPIGVRELGWNPWVVRLVANAGQIGCLLAWISQSDQIKSDYAQSNHTKSAQDQDDHTQDDHAHGADAPLT